MLPFVPQTFYAAMSMSYVAACAGYPSILIYAFGAIVYALLALLSKH